MVNLLFIEDDQALTKPGVVRSIYDPTAGTGGMLSVAGEHLASLNPDARLVMYGQELNPESYAICKAGHAHQGAGHRQTSSLAIRFPPMVYMGKFSTICSPIHLRRGVEEDRERNPQGSEQMGFNGRFGPGLPRVSDGSLLFLLHLISKMRPAMDGGSRFSIVLNGSPLFTGGAGSGESEIRRYVLENDLVEAIIGLPTDMFYNTGISTYVWIVSNRKPATRKGKVQLIDASSFWQKMRKSLGSKRKELSPETHRGHHPPFGQFEESTRDGGTISRIFRTRTSATAPSPSSALNAMQRARLCSAPRVKVRQAIPGFSPARHRECTVSEDVDTTSNAKFCRMPQMLGSITTKTKVGYEIPFHRHFYVFKPPRPLSEIDAELKSVTDRILTMIVGCRNEFPTLPEL